MASSALVLASVEGTLETSQRFHQPFWYAAYTSANHERRVATQLAQRSIEHFLPLYGSIRRWKDRRIKLELPLFPGYVFVYLSLRDRMEVLRVPGVSRLVGFGGLPCPLATEEIELLRNGLAGNLKIEPYPYLRVGSRVCITCGPLRGTQGILVRRKNIYRVILTIDLISSSAAVEVGAGDIERIP